MASRNQSLDVLRGIAVLMVICAHYPIYHVMMPLGFGVDLFFVLSGFLISGLLFSDLQRYDSIRLGRFFFRRGLKIYPPFALFLALTALCFPSVRGALWIEVLFLQNYIYPPVTVWGHLWSLAVEEHFYLTLPIVLLLLNRAKLLRAIPAISAGLFAVCFVLRIAYLDTHILLGNTPIIPTHLRIDALFGGVFLGWLFHYRRARFDQISRPQLAIAGVLLLIPSFIHRGAAFTSFALLADSIGFGCLLVWAVTRSFRGLGSLAEIGRHSYSIYLWHLLMLVFLWHEPGTSVSRFLFYVLMSLAIGVTMSVVFEQPILRLRDRRAISRELKISRNEAVVRSAWRRRPRALTE